MINMSRYDGLTNDGKWRGTSADDSVIFEVHDEHGEVVDFKTIALVMRDSDHYLTEDNPDIRLMVDAPLLLEEVKRLQPMATELIAIWEILQEDYPQVDRAIVEELIERKIGDYEVIE
tara:strand:+ start:3639 stop:3992 length:354 start_codon:yes stop_codon:yes gene_type:complete